jgi:class 3 adenylate cyclase
MAFSRLPSGTVTFLFTDIERSTKLLHELGPERYTEALDLHRQVVRESCLRHEGVEVDTQGDAFFVAFPTAPGALEAAREAQEALAIPVRMGIHTGTPVLTGAHYVGIDVHKAARIAAAGHRGAGPRLVGECGAARERGLARSRRGQGRRGREHSSRSCGAGRRSVRRGLLARSRHGTRRDLGLLPRGVASSS